MSADNLVQAVHFRKQDGSTVWRVAQAWMSSLPWDLCYMMSTQARERQFEEYSNYADALAAAHAMVRRLDICEYGVSANEPHEPGFTLQELKQHAALQGYKQAQDLQECSDAALARLPRAWWVKK